MRFSKRTLTNNEHQAKLGTYISFAVTHVVRIIRIFTNLTFACLAKPVQTEFSGMI